MHKYLLRIAAAIISICFGVYLAKGNLDWIPNWMLLVVALSAGIYWLSFEPNVREACADLWRREPSRLVYSSDYEAPYRARRRIKGALFSSAVVLGICVVTGTMAWVYRAHQLGISSTAHVQFLRPEVQEGVPFTVNKPISVNETVINKGPDVAHGFRFHVGLTIIELPPTAEAEDRVWRDYIVVLRDISDSGNDLGVDDHQWQTAVTPILYNDEVDHLESGRHHLYITGIARYRDSSGRDFESELCQYIQPSGNPVVRHNCQHHNRIAHLSDSGT